MALNLVKREEIEAKIRKTIEDGRHSPDVRLEVVIVDIPTAKVIGKSIECLPTLQSLFWSEIFKRTEKKDIPLALSYLLNGIMTANCHIELLDLSNNCLGSSGFKSLKLFLESSCCYTLKKLKLNDTHMGIEGAKLLSEGMCKCLENSREAGTLLKLEELHCNNNQLRDDGLAYISKFLEKMKSMESVDLARNKINAKGVKALSDALSSSPNMHFIDLQGNYLSSEGVCHLSCNLGAFKWLEFLNLRQCGLRTGDIQILAAVLKDNCPSLGNIDFSSNLIDSVGFDTLLNALKGKYYFNELQISENCLSPEEENFLTCRIVSMTRIATRKRTRKRRPFNREAQEDSSNQSSEDESSNGEGSMGSFDSEETEDNSNLSSENESSNGDGNIGPFDGEAQEDNSNQSSENESLNGEENIGPFDGEAQEDNSNQSSENESSNGEENIGPIDGEEPKDKNNQSSEGESPNGEGNIGHLLVRNRRKTATNLRKMSLKMETKIQDLLMGRHRRTTAINPRKMSPKIERKIQDLLMGRHRRTTATNPPKMSPQMERKI